MTLEQATVAGFIFGAVVGAAYRISKFLWVKRGMATWRRDVNEPWGHAIELNDPELNAFFEKESAQITHWIWTKNPLVWIRQRNRKWGVQKLVGEDSPVEVM
jgi:hypothetical protein